MSKIEDSRTLIGTIDITPTWVSMVGSILALIECGNFESREVGMEEIERMAKVADLAAAYMKRMEALRDALTTETDTGPVFSFANLDSAQSEADFFELLNTPILATRTKGDGNE